MLDIIHVQKRKTNWYNCLLLNYTEEKKKRSTKKKNKKIHYILLSSKIEIIIALLLSCVSFMKKMRFMRRGN